MSKLTTVPAQVLTWAVHAAEGLPPLTVRVPESAWPGTIPPFLRLDLRRPGLRGRLSLRPVLKTAAKAGGRFMWLDVPAGLVPAGLDLGDGPLEVSVSAASPRAFRLYRLSCSLGQLFSAVATIVGGLLVAVGAAELATGFGQGLVVAGAALTILAAAALLISAWRAPVA